jgi:hypothetical protein
VDKQGVHYRGETAKDAGECHRMLKAALSHLPTPGWQPIETAPRNGQCILLWHKSRPAVGSWSHDESGWSLERGSVVHPMEPTDWMQLPQPPRC